MADVTASAGRIGTGWKARLAAPGRGLALTGLGLLEAFLLCLMALAACLVFVGVGVYLFPVTARALRGLAATSSRWAAEWSGITVAEPPAWPPARSGFVGAARDCWDLVGDPTFWRTVVWATLNPQSGAVIAAVPFSLLVYGVFGALVQPFIWDVIENAGGSNWYGWIHVNSSRRAAYGVPLGIVFIVIALWSGPWWLAVHAKLTRGLLAPRSAELTRQVARLSDIRTAVTDDSAAELRRIERDLHDGAQARLVAMGMTLDAAERHLTDDPEAARLLLLQVRQSSSAALQELRDLVRGIHPPVLADRGLADAIRALALDTIQDVTVDAALASRPALPVESAAYFAVNELLTNTAKHAGATRICVVLGHEHGRLYVEVSDNGRGGADPSRGSGLHGIGRRLAAFDGTMDVDSPPGGPTTVRLEIPCVLSSPKTFSS